jgi:hypothetical protein
MPSFYASLRGLPSAKSEKCHMRASLNFYIAWMVGGLVGCADMMGREPSPVPCGVTRVGSAKGGLRIYFDHSWNLRLAVDRTGGQRKQAYQASDGVVSRSVGASATYLFLKIGDEASAPTGPWSGCTYQAKTDGKQTYLKVSYFEGDIEPNGETCQVIPSREREAQCKGIVLPE